MRIKKKNTQSRQAVNLGGYPEEKNGGGKEKSYAA